MALKREDLTGQRFGRILVLGYSHTASNSVRWHCRCDCGTEKVIAGGSLRRGTTVSCGCQKVEKLVERSTKHGLMPRVGRTPTYYSWSNMIRRTTNPDHPRWADWGGRGITVCERWRDYPAFLADMGEKPPGTTLDRIDNDGNYEPANCRWLTHAKQQRNKRRYTLTAEKVREIQRLYEDGASIGVVAEVTGIERHTVGTVCIVLDVLADDPVTNSGE